MKENEWELKEYCDLLKKADDLYRRAERTNPNARPNKRTLMNVAIHNRGLSTCALLHVKAETAYERALERLEELLGIKPYLRECLDRPVSFDINNYNLSLDPQGVPRLKSSHSQYVIRESRRNKRDK
jgi:hypothetical protein